MLLIRLRIRDFEAIDDVELQLGSFTVLIGNSDQGKSSIVKAIYYALMNKKGTDFIRQGTTACKIDFFFDNGAEIHWTKGASSKYIIKYKGKVRSYDKITGIPPEISAIAKEWKVEGGDPELIQVQSQRDKEFLLGLGAGQLTRTLDDLDGKFYRQALTVCSSHLNSVKRQLSRLEPAYNKLKEKAEIATDLELVVTRFDKLREMSKLMALVGLPQIESLDVSSIGLMLKFYLMAPVDGLGGIVRDNLNLSAFSLEYCGVVSEEKTLISEGEKLQHSLGKVQEVLFSTGYCPVCKQRVVKR